MAKAADSAGLKADSGAGKARINLQRAAILLIDDGLGLELLSQIFYGLGARTLYRCRSAREAKAVLTAHIVDLIVTEAILEDADGYAFIRMLRTGDVGEANRFTPVIVLSAHTASSKVASSRDCGANFFVAKPVSPRVVMERLVWVAREQRPYLETDSYAGPDRRFQNEALPEGAQGRRRGDRHAVSAPQPPTDPTTTESSAP